MAKIYVLEGTHDGVVGAYDTRAEALDNARPKLSAEEFQELCANGEAGEWSISEMTEEEFFAEPTEEEMAEYKARRSEEFWEEYGRELEQARVGLPSRYWEPGCEDA